MDTWEGLAAKEGLQGTAPGSLEGAADNMRGPGHCKLLDRDRGLALALTEDVEEEEAGKLGTLEEGREEDRGQG